MALRISQSAFQKLAPPRPQIVERKETTPEPKHDDSMAKMCRDIAAASAEADARLAATLERITEKLSAAADSKEEKAEHAGYTVRFTFKRDRSGYIESAEATMIPIKES